MIQYPYSEVRPQGRRRPLVIDSMIMIGLVGLGLGALRLGIEADLASTERLLVVLSITIPLCLTVSYAISNAAQVRSGWPTESPYISIIYVAMLIGLILSFAVLTVLSPPVALMMMLIEGTILAWSSSWI